MIGTHPYWGTVLRESVCRLGTDISVGSVADVSQTWYSVEPVNSWVVLLEMSTGESWLPGSERYMSWLRLLRNRSLGKKWFQNLLGAFLKEFSFYIDTGGKVSSLKLITLWLRGHSLTSWDKPTQLPVAGATYQEGQLGLIGALDAFCVKFALLEAAVHDVHSTCHPTLDVL